MLILHDCLWIIGFFHWSLDFDVDMISSWCRSCSKVNIGAYEFSRIDTRKCCKPSAGIVEFLPYFYIPKTESPFVLRFWMLISRYVVLFVFL